MRVEDVDEAGGGRPPRARRSRRSRRVFVLERVDTMNDEVANRLLKTLEEPASYVHLILLTDAPRPGARDGGLALPAGALRAAARGARSPRMLEAEGVRARAGPAPARGWRSGNADAGALPGLRRGRGAARRGGRASCAARARRPRAPTSRGDRCSSAPSERRAEAEEAVAGARARAARAGAEGPRARGARDASSRRSAKRDGRRARHGGARPRRSTLAGLAFRDLVCVAEGARGGAGHRPHARARGRGRGPRPAPAARGRRALRGRARSRWS